MVGWAIEADFQPPPPADGQQTLKSLCDRKEKAINSLRKWLIPCTFPNRGRRACSQTKPAHFFLLRISLSVQPHCQSRGGAISSVAFVGSDSDVHVMLSESITHAQICSEKPLPPSPGISSKKGRSMKMPPVALHGEN